MVFWEFHGDVGIGNKMFKGVIIPVISFPFMWIEGSQVKRECVSFLVIVMALQHSFSLGNSCGSTCTASVLVNNTNTIHVPVIRIYSCVLFQV